MCIQHLCENWNNLVSIKFSNTRKNVHAHSPRDIVRAAILSRFHIHDFVVLGCCHIIGCFTCLFNNFEKCHSSILISSRIPAHHVVSLTDLRIIHQICFNGFFSDVVQAGELLEALVQGCEQVLQRIVSHLRHVRDGAAAGQRRARRSHAHLPPQAAVLLNTPAFAWRRGCAPHLAHLALVVALGGRVLARSQLPLRQDGGDVSLADRHGPRASTAQLLSLPCTPTK